MKYLLLLTLLCTAHLSYGQFGISYHQSSLPFLGVNYGFTDRFSAEIRLSTDMYFEDFSPELVATYNYLKREDYELYAGIGGRANNLSGLVIPLGLRVYPFEAKAFGFHVEVAPLIGEYDGILRGSLGINYRFLKD